MATMPADACTASASTATRTARSPSLAIIVRFGDQRSARIEVKGEETADTIIRTSMSRPTPAAPPPCR